jgi:hypothetical protein
MCCLVVEMGVSLTFTPKLSLSCSNSDLGLLSSWDYRHESVTS